MVSVCGDKRFSKLHLIEAKVNRTIVLYIWRFTRKGVGRRVCLADWFQTVTNRDGQCRDIVNHAAIEGGHTIIVTVRL